MGLGLLHQPHAARRGGQVPARNLRLMRILHVASEVAPYSKTGGLADVLGALPRALAALGHEVTVVTPRYRSIDPERFGLARRLRGLATPLGADTVAVGVFEGQAASTPHVRVFLVDHKPSFDRDGFYGDAHGDYADNARRFALLGSAALALAAEFGVWPDVVHGHDWQAGPAILFAKRAGAICARRRRSSRCTISRFKDCSRQRSSTSWDCPGSITTPTASNSTGRPAYLKAGLALADRLSTVSPRYAKEIQTAEQGLGIDGLLRARTAVLQGILNGADYDIWNPESDIHLPATYSAESLTASAAARRSCSASSGCRCAPRCRCADRSRGSPIKRASTWCSARCRRCSKATCSTSCSARAIRRWRARSRSCRRAFPRSWRCASATTSRWPIASRPAAICT